MRLAKRACNSNRGTELGAFLERLVVEVEEDRRSLEELMAALGSSGARSSRRSAWWPSGSGA